jgi:hypothetical protein
MLSTSFPLDTNARGHLSLPLGPFYLSRIATLRPLFATFLAPPTLPPHGTPSPFHLNHSTVGRLLSMKAVAPVRLSPL